MLIHVYLTLKLVVPLWVQIFCTVEGDINLNIFFSRPFEDSTQWKDRWGLCTSVSVQSLEGPLLFPKCVHQSFHWVPSSDGLKSLVRLMVFVEHPGLPAKGLSLVPHQLRSVQPRGSGQHSGCCPDVQLWCWSFRPPSSYSTMQPFQKFCLWRSWNYEIVCWCGCLLAKHLSWDYTVVPLSKVKVKVSFIVNSATCTVHTYRELKLRYSLTPWCIQITLNTNSRTQKYR